MAMTPMQKWSGDVEEESFYQIENQYIGCIVIFCCSSQVAFSSPPLSAERSAKMIQARARCERKLEPN